MWIAFYTNRVDCFAGESYNVDNGHVALMYYPEDGDGLSPILLFFRDGLKEEKVVSFLYSRFCMKYGSLYVPKQYPVKKHVFRHLMLAYRHVYKKG